MSSMKSAVSCMIVGWRFHYGGKGAGGGGRGRRTKGVGFLHTFPLLPNHSIRPRTFRILIVTASSKRASSKKRTKSWQDKSIATPSSEVKELKETEIQRSADIGDDPAFLSSESKPASEINSFSTVNTSDTSLGPKREVVLKACVTTCAAIFMVGILIQQATHLAAESGWPVPDSTVLINSDVDSWHLEVICGLVLTISLSRQLLLLAWPEFLESNDTANKEVLGPLQITDYAIVAILPAISEELLFRGALLPLCGLDWKGISITGSLFGVLHLTGGRKNAFAIWASIVGVLYGLACVSTGSVFVPMVAHAANNLIGAAVWRLKQKDGLPHS